MNITPRTIIAAAEFVDAHGDRDTASFAPTGLSNAGAAQITALVKYAQSIGWAA